MKGEVLSIELGRSLKEYGAAKHKRFDGYSAGERANILSTFEVQPLDIASLFFCLEDEAHHYVDLRAEYDLRKQEVRKKRAAHLSHLKDAIDLLLETERELGQPDVDLMHRLERRRIRIELQESVLDPFNAAEGYIPQLRFFGICDPSPDKDRQPEHSFVAALCRAFADANGFGLSDLTITIDVEKNPFMRFAWACTRPIKSRYFTLEAIAGAARAYRSGNLESAALYAR